MEEEWVLFGESGSDADTVQFADDSDGDSASDKSGEMSFTKVQIGGNRRATDALGSSVESPISGENKEEEESNGAHGYFDLNLQALVGSKAVFGASGDCIDPSLAASILSMGNVGSDIHCSEAEDTDSDSDDDELPDLDDIDMESIGPADGDGVEHPERRACAHCANMDTDQGSDDAAEVVIYDDIDTQSSDPAESDSEHPEYGYACYENMDTESSNADMEQHESYSCGTRLDDIDLESICADDIDTDSDDGTESSDAEDSDCSDDFTERDYSDDGIESSDTEESYYSDEGTEFFGGGDDTEESYFAVTPQHSLAAGAPTAASRPPTAPHLFFPNRAGASTAASRPPTAPHLFFPNRDGASTAASRPPSAPHLYFPKRTVTN